MISVKSLGLDSSIILKKATFKNLENPEKVLDAIRKNRDVINEYAKHNDIKIRGAFTEFNNGQDAILFTLSPKTKHHKINEFLEKLRLFRCPKIRSKARDLINKDNENSISEALRRGQSKLNYSTLFQRKYV